MIDLNDTLQVGAMIAFAAVLSFMLLAGILLSAWRKARSIFTPKETSQSTQDNHQASYVEETSSSPTSMAYLKRDETRTPPWSR